VTKELGDLAKPDTYDNWDQGDIWMPTHYDHGGKG